MANTERNGIHNNRDGFSMVELLIITAVSMIITMTAAPNMINAIGNMRLRSSMTSLSGVMQNCRTLAVKQNQVMTTHFVVTNYGDGAASGVVAYVKRASDSSAVSTHDSQVQLEEPVTRVTTLSGPGAPTIPLDSSILGFTPQTGDPSFATTGLPCSYSAGICSNNGFVFYFHDTRSSGRNAWAAISVSPAGRLKTWFWSGSAWTN